MNMEDELELKALKLKKMMRLMASREASKSDKHEERLSFNDALKIVREHLVDRGDEVLNAALEQYPEEAKRIVRVLAEKIVREGFRGKISGGALLSLFEYLGMPVKLRTKILYYKKGEYKSIADLIK